jgi:ABC-2 type transport system ATP-binding protein
LESAVQVENLNHSFGPRRAINDLSFEVRRGEVFGLLGPNGAGKTTSVRLLNGLYRPTSGSIRVLGIDPGEHGQEVRSRTGVLTETPALYERLTALENLEFFGTLAGMKPPVLQRSVAEMLAFFGLEGRASDKVGAYSKGMKQRLALARALLAKPELIFLDEPTSGLDPESAQQVRELIQSIRKRDGHTVVLCTHHLDEAERLCDRVGVMNSGRFLAVGSLAELAARFHPGLWVEIQLFQPLSASWTATDLPGVLALEPGFPLIRVHVEQEAVIPALVSSFAAGGAQILRVQPIQASLEEIYFKLQQQA